ncbi:Cellulose synthase-like protein A2 [Capnocytophaga canimorsus Cc5]|uniref:Cellulose synthase-like protein A2 n=2 Tax=Capnocytophaga canimorsus TaxID=28188 RepID=F9YSF1_CAPCC|nr:Cellulose synthase-like protein A2 [Capnocytophaga canimorsus Cc5]
MQPKNVTKMGLILTYIVIAIYSVALVLIFLYSLSMLNLLINYLKHKRINHDSPKFDLLDAKQVPYVTIQLPLYNEKYVVKRLLENISKLEYPKNKLEIQVLDDSTDESVVETAAIINQLQQSGLDIQHIRRKDRKGFKAGALKAGTAIAKGDFIAIFDADFMPQPDWLKKTVIYFKDPEIGVVQTRWGHINRDYSILTKIQALALDVHFTLEQVGRNSKGHFINFNGTAGIWRKSCIYDAGNWEGDTLTEDLDLSYRAQLKNWKFKYLEDVETPAELPVVISAARSQQFRWNKGGAENFRKSMARVLASKNISFKTKFHGVMHLLNSSMFLCVFLVSILSIPMLYIKNTYGHLGWVFQITSFFIISTIILFICYWVTYRNIQGKSFDDFIDYIKLFFTFFSVALGFSLHNTIAVLEGHTGKKSEFVRTPKFNISSLKDSWKDNKYINTKLSPNMIFEFILMGYFLFGMYSAIRLNDFGLFPFHLMLFLGFGFVFFKSLTSKA